LNRESPILLPGPDDGWEVWNPGGRAPSLARSLPSPAAWTRADGDVRIGLPVTQCRTFSFVVPTTDAALFADLAKSHLERRGLAQPEDQAHHVLAQEGGETWLAVDALPAPFPEPLRVAEALAYAPAGRWHLFPDGKVVVAREQGKWVLMAGKGGHLAFAERLTGGTELDPALSREVNLAVLSLQASGLLGETVAVEVWSLLPAEDTGAREFARGLTVPCTFTERPAPDGPGSSGASGPLLPRAVREARERRARMAKFRFGLVVAAAVYGALGIGLAVMQKARADEAARLEAKVATDRPAAALVQTALDRSRELEPAYEKRFYPMRQLNEVARMMPPSGVVILRFVTQDRNLRIEGLARDPQMAFQLKEDLEKSPEFPGYSWEMNPPSVNQNNSAAFRLEGKYAGAQ